MDDNAESNISIPPEDRKRSGVPSMIPPFVWLVTIFLAGVVFGNLLWLFAADVLALDREEITTQITISDTDTIKDISKDLKEHGLVNYPWLFRFYAKITNAGQKIKPGTYTLSSHYDYHALIKVLSAGKVQRSTSFFDTNQGVIEIKWLNWNY